jgi:hypothetical protein
MSIPRIGRDIGLTVAEDNEDGVEGEEEVEKKRSKSEGMGVVVGEDVDVELMEEIRCEKGVVDDDVDDDDDDDDGDDDDGDDDDDDE